MALQAGGQQNAAIAKTMSNDDLILDYIRRKPKASNVEIAENLEIDKSTVGRRLRYMEDQGRISWSDKGWQQ